MLYTYSLGEDLLQSCFGLSVYTIVRVVSCLWHDHYKDLMPDLPDWSCVFLSMGWLSQIPRWLATRNLWCVGPSPNSGRHLSLIHTTFGNPWPRNTLVATAEFQLHRSSTSHPHLSSFSTPAQSQKLYWE